MESYIFELRCGRKGLAPGALEGLDDVASNMVRSLLGALQDVHRDEVVGSAGLTIDDSVGVIRIVQPGRSFWSLWLGRQQLQNIVGQVAMRIDDATALAGCDELPQQSFQEFTFVVEFECNLAPSISPSDWLIMQLYRFFICPFFTRNPT